MINGKHFTLGYNSWMKENGLHNLFFAEMQRICSMSNFNSNFILGSANFSTSALKDHGASRCHNQEVREKEHEEAVAAGRSLPPRERLYNKLVNCARYSTYG